MKGQASYPFSMIEALFTFLLVMSIALGSQTYTESYFREEALDIRADRVENAATSLENYPGGLMELDMEGYEFRVDGDQVYIRYFDSEESRDLKRLNYSTVDGPDRYEEFDQVCLEKTFETELVIQESC